MSLVKMSKKSKIYKTAFIFSLFLLVFPLGAESQDTVGIEDFVIEANDNPDVVINPIEEAAPTSDHQNQAITDSVTAPTPTDPLAPIIFTEEEEPIAEVKKPEPKAIPYSGQYYDADSIGGNKALGNNSPRQVDPKYEPGTRFVVVEKGAGSDSVQAQLISAQRALKLERYAAALDMFESLYKKTPNSPPVLMGLAIAQQNNGLTESAIATYEELLSLNPNNVDAMVNMLGLMKIRYPEIAFRRLKDLWDAHPNNAAIAAQLGLVSAGTGNTQEALRYLGIAASIDPQNASHYYNMAVLSDRAGAKKQAIELYQKALEVDITYASGRSVPREQIYDRLAYLRRS